MHTESDPPRANPNSCSGFSCYNSNAPAFPLLLSVPHAGRDYPAELLNDLRIKPEELVRLEDRYADRLAQPAIAAGIPAIIAHRARAWIDLNRSEDELDPEMVTGLPSGYRPSNSAKMRGGLGLIPRRLSQLGDIWRRPLDFGAVNLRLTDFHRPYHAAIEQALREMRARFGTAILVDLHSMPPVSAMGIDVPHFVIGDRFGQSAKSVHSELLLSNLRDRGVPAALNHPYAGDHMLRRHSNVRQNVHAIQIEVDRTLYLESGLREPSQGLAKCAALVTELLFLLADHAAGLSLPLAAE
jgi:N-formylglutamate amidohydrolase